MLSQPEIIIKVSEASARHGALALWEKASFEIARGQFIVILGPNGSGKTTLFKVLLGLARPASGSITILGQAIGTQNQKIGYVPQRHPIDPEVALEALELVRLGLNGHRWGFHAAPFGQKEHEAAHQALAVVGASGLAHRALGTLSGGELQRIFLAEAIIGNPEILLLDEPLANVDLRYGASLVQIINSLVRERRVSALLIAHDINPLLPYVDQVMYVANGRIAMGRPDEVMTSEVLTQLYGAPVEVLRDSHGRVAVVGGEEYSHHN